jgi:hypothetical protein
MVSLREVMEQIDFERQQDAEAEAMYWRQRLEQRRLSARLTTPSTPPATRTPQRAASRSSGAIEYKSEPVAVPGSRWLRLGDGEWVRVS